MSIHDTIHSREQAIEEFNKCTDYQIREGIRQAFKLPYPDLTEWYGDTARHMKDHSDKQTLGNDYGR